MSKLSLVIFDWDGTLMNSSAKIVASMQAAAADCNVGALGHREIENIIGLSLPKAISVLYPEAPLKVKERIGDRYSYHFVNTQTAPSPLFAGVESLLEGLRREGLQLAVATGKSRRGLNRVLAETGLGAHFVTSRCADETESKPHPAMVVEILSELDISPESALVVGDTEYDLEMASRANVASIGVTYGAHNRDQLEQHKPLRCVEKSIHLFDSIKSLR